MVSVHARKRQLIRRRVEDEDAPARAADEREPVRSTRRCREGVAAKGDGRQGRWRRLARLKPKLAQPKRECVSEGAGRGNSRGVLDSGVCRKEQQ